jgi:hypothetical protein
MGMMYCARGDCANALCQRYSQEHGYICEACFEELVASGATNIAAFMDTDPSTDLSIPRSVYEEIFPE